MSRRKTIEEFKQEVYNLVGNEYTVKSNTYVNAHTKLLIIHNKCGYGWKVTPLRFNRGQRCPICSKKPKDSAERLAYEVLIDTNNNWYLDYNTKSDIFLTSRVNLINWKTGESVNLTWNKFRVGGINDSSFKYLVSSIKNNSVKKRVQLTKLAISKITPPLVFKHHFDSIVNGNYMLLSPYQGSNKKIKVKHLVCGNTYWVRQDKFINEGQRCAWCASHHSIQSYSKRLSDVSKSRYILINNNEFKNSKSYATYLCTRCGRRFKQRADLMLQGYGCPYCNQSTGERLVDRVLSQVYQLEESQDFYYGYVLPNKLHLDFYLPSSNLAIEYDGKQHYVPVDYFGGEEGFKKIQDRDRKKDKYCKEYGIKLIRIPYTINTYRGIKELLASYL